MFEEEFEVLGAAKGDLLLDLLGAGQGVGGEELEGAVALIDVVYSGSQPIFAVDFVEQTDLVAGRGC